MIKVIKFSTETCGPCRSYAPIFDKVRAQFPNVQFVSLDANMHYQLAQKYGIRGVPATIFERNGSEVNRRMGIVSENELKQIINSL